MIHKHSIMMQPPLTPPPQESHNRTSEARFLRTFSRSYPISCSRVIRPPLPLTIPVTATVTIAIARTIAIAIAIAINMSSAF